ncbi:unnamed protein product [Oikopleura dioica]|uniref:Uncharacterized protein n=1 Tax=Oikopleura dioica TaxID=34765 RepID=E4WZ91_OIKDI|nr:unnamed protein product [Oikopleura dioica]
MLSAAASDVTKTRKTSRMLLDNGRRSNTTNNLLGWMRLNLFEGQTNSVSSTQD